MDIHRLRLIIDYMRDSLKPYSLILSGGEPTILKDFPQILEMIRRNLKLEIFHLHTNATLVKNHISQLSRGVANLHSATVSLHGHNPQIQDSITRVEGSFSKAVQGIRTLLDIDYEVAVVCVVCRFNYHYINEITDFLLGLGSQKVEIRLPFAGPRSNLSSVIPERKLWGDAIEDWFIKYSSEPRVCFAAAEAHCFGRTVPLTPVNEQLSYHFFDFNTAPGIERRSRKQLGAIWQGAFRGYKKSHQCCICLFDTTCKGFSPLETEAGSARYKPFSLEDFLNMYNHGAADDKVIL